MITTATTEEPSVTATVGEWFTNTMAAIVTFDTAKQKMIDNINECLTLARPHIERLASTKIQSKNVFALSENLCLLIPKGENEVSVYESYKALDTRFSEIEETEQLRTELTAEQLAERYGDVEFANILCRALKAKHQHYSTINSLHAQGGTAVVKTVKEQTGMLDDR